MEQAYSAEKIIFSNTNSWAQQGNCVMCNTVKYKDFKQDLFGQEMATAFVIG